jgi:hypothetical protein
MFAALICSAAARTSSRVPGVLVGAQARGGEVVVVDVHDRHRDAVRRRPQPLADRVGGGDGLEQVVVEGRCVVIRSDAVGRRDDRARVDHELQRGVLAEDHVGQPLGVAQAVLVLLQQFRVRALRLDGDLDRVLAGVVLGRRLLEGLLGQRVVRVPDGDLRDALGLLERSEGAVGGIGRVVARGAGVVAAVAVAAAGCGDHGQAERRGDAGTSGEAHAAAVCTGGRTGAERGGGVILAGRVGGGTGWGTRRPPSEP